MTSPAFATSCLAMALLTSAIAAPASHAEEFTGILKKIKDSRTISVAYREDIIPFSYLDDKRNVTGYSYDITAKIAEAIRQTLQIPNIEIKPVQVTGQSRFAMVQHGSIDIECVSTTNNTERQKQWAFSNTFFIIGTRLLTRKDSGIKDFSDLVGKTVVVRASSTSESILQKLNAEKKYRINIISTRDREILPMTVMQTGQADAYLNDDAILYGAIADSWRPSEWIVTGKPQSHEAYGCMMQKNEPALKKIVDDTIAKMILSGGAEALYKKWFLSPIPPKGINLNFPLSEAMIKLFKNPNDKPFD